MVRDAVDVQAHVVAGDDAVAVVAEHNGRWRVAESETDPLTGVRIERVLVEEQQVAEGLHNGTALPRHRADESGP